jgi:hypothetical protein
VVKITDCPSRARARLVMQLESPYGVTENCCCDLNQWSPFKYGDKPAWRVEEFLGLNRAASDSVQDWR